MPARLNMRRVAFEKLVGGINDAEQQTTIKTTEAAALRNVRLEPIGGISKRRGYYIVNTTSIVASGTITGVFQYRRWSGNDDLIVTLNSGSAATAPRIFRRDAGTTTFTNITPSSGFVDGDKSFAVSNDLLYIGQSGTIHAWDGSATLASALVVASSPAGLVVGDFKRHLAVVNITARPANWEFSNLGAPSAYRDSDRIGLDRPTVGEAPLYDDYYVFTDDRMFRIAGDDRDNFRFDPVRGSVGLEHHGGLVNVENRNLLVWPWHGQFYEFDGTRPRVISRRIGRLLNGTSEFFLVDVNRLDQIRGVNLTQQRRVAFLVVEEGNTQPDAILSYWYDLRTPDPETGELIGSWTLDTYDRAFSSIGVAIESQEEVLYAGTFDGQVCVLETGRTDGASSSTATDGVAINAIYQTGPITGDAAELTKRWREFLPIVGQTGNFNLTIDIYENYGSLFGGSTQINLATTGFSSLWGTAIWGTDVWGSAVAVQRRVQLGNRAQTISVRISDNSTNPRWRIEAFYVWFQTLAGLRRF